MIIYEYNTYGYNMIIIWLYMLLCEEEDRIFLWRAGITCTSSPRAQLRAPETEEIISAVEDWEARKISVALV